jgi:hypothetical protein
MSTFRNALICGLALALAGCPTPPPSSGGDAPGQPGQPGQPGEGPPGQPGQPGQPGEQPPGQPGEQPPGQPGEQPPGQPGQGGEAPTPGTLPEDGDMPEAPRGKAPDPGDLPNFDDLIGDGASITIVVNVTGATQGQVDFQTIEEKDGNSYPKILHVERFTSTPVKVKAPANYDGDVYISVAAFEGDGALQPEIGEVGLGGSSDAIQLGTTDVNVDVTIGTEPAWMQQFLKRMPGGEDPPMPY